MAKEEKEKVFFKLPEEWEVTNVRVLEFGTFFTLKMPGLELYNLRKVPAGKNYDEFIGMPEDKGKDGDYYKRFRIYFSDEDTEAILDEVEKQAEKLRKKARHK